MHRLILRDVLVSPRLAAVLALFYTLYLAMAARSPEAYLMTTFVFSLAFALGGLANDARRGAEALWASLPLPRARLVRGRYLAVVVLGALGLAVSWAVGRLAAAPLGAEAQPLPAAVYAAVWVVLLLIGGIYQPFHFKLGPGAGLGAFGAVAGALTLVAAAATQLAVWLLGAPDALVSAATWRMAGRVASGRAEAPSDLPGGVLLLVALAVVGTLYVLSMRISEQFYRERDL